MDLEELRDAVGRLGYADGAHIADGAVAFGLDGVVVTARPHDDAVDWHFVKNGGTPMSGSVPLGDAKATARRLGTACLKAIHDSPADMLMMRVLRVESPELFDGTDSEPLAVVGVDYGEYVPAICETCGDYPEHLDLGYVTRGGWLDSEGYLDFGLPEVLDALECYAAMYGA